MSQEAHSTPSLTSCGTIDDTDYHRNRCDNCKYIHIFLLCFPCGLCSRVLNVRLRLLCSLRLRNVHLSLSSINRSKTSVRNFPCTGLPSEHEKKWSNVTTHIHTHPHTHTGHIQYSTVLACFFFVAGLWAGFEKKWPSSFIASSTASLIIPFENMFVNPIPLHPSARKDPRHFPIEIIGTSPCTLVFFT